MPAAVQTLPVTAPTSITVCALRRTYIETVYDGAGAVISERVRESGRAEFMTVGDVTHVKIDHSGFTGCWTVYTRTEARKLWRELANGSHAFYPGTWERCDSATKLLGQVEIPAHSLHHAWGEGANRVARVNVDAQVCPVVDLSDYRARNEQVAFVTFMFARPGESAKLDRTALRAAAGESVDVYV